MNTDTNRPDDPDLDDLDGLAASLEAVVRVRGARRQFRRVTTIGARAPTQLTGAGVFAGPYFWPLRQVDAPGDVRNGP
jgi:hypothetical protein